MCGICGIVGRADSEANDAVRRMTETLRHRGPDDDGIVRLPLGGDGQACGAIFGFRRLAILDLSPSGHQPMVDPVTGDCLVFNGEIYNYLELRESLAAVGVTVTSTGDAEVLLKGLSRWGEAFVEKLDGMYAFAFYKRATRRVLLARDPLGIKPLYIAEHEGRIVFGSEIRSLLASGVVPDEYDPAGVASYLAYGAPQDPLTIHRAIKSFPVGSFQWLEADERGSLRIGPRVRFWRFPLPAPAETMDAAVAATHEALSRSVRRQLASDVPLGVFLSGGIDSGVIAALASEASGQLKTFSVGFESENMASELPIARETAARIGSDHHEIMIGKADALNLWQQWLAVADRPSVDGFNTFIVSKATRLGGAKVVLSGLGADELFGGYANFFRVRRLAPWIRAAAALPLVARRFLATTATPLCPLRYRERLIMLATSSGRPVDVDIDIRRMLSAGALESLGLSARDTGLSPNYLPAELYDLCEPECRDEFQGVMRVESYCYMSNTLLRDSDINSMAHSLELRVPFLGREVVDVAARTPGHLHLEHGTPKAVLRRAVGHLLPPHVLSRPKTGFSLPVGDWMYAELRDACEAAVNALQDVPFLDHSAVRRLWSSFSHQRRHSYWMKPTLLVSLGSYVANRSSSSTG